MSNTIYVPSFPGSVGNTGILPAFKLGGFGSDGGGGGNLWVPSAAEYNWADGTVLGPLWSEKWGCYTSNPTGAYAELASEDPFGSYAPSQTYVLARNNQFSTAVTEWNCVTFIEASAAGKQIDTSAGLRIETVARHRRSGYTTSKSQNVGICLHNSTDGPQADNTIYAFTVTSSEPDTYIIGQKVGGVGTTLLNSSATGIDTADYQYSWLRVRLELPAGLVGNPKMSMIAYGSYGDLVSNELTATTPLSVQGLLFDEISVGLFATAQATILRVAYMWVGTASSPWPS